MELEEPAGAFAETTRVLEEINVAFNKRDVDALLALLDPEIESVSDPEGPLQGKVVKGHEAYRAYVEEILDMWVEFRQAPLGLVDAGGDKGVLLLRFKGTAKGGTQVDSPGAQIWQVRDGKGVRSESFSGPRAWTRALGAAKVSVGAADMAIRSASR